MLFGSGLGLAAISRSTVLLIIWWRATARLAASLLSRAAMVADDV
jgi:hypothetical protein